MGLKIMAELGLDGKGFEAGMKRAEGLAHGVAEGLKGFVIQAVGIYTVEQAISKTVETAKELVETSRRLSIAPEQLQVMRQAAKDSGVEFQKLAELIEKTNVARDKALRPVSEGASARRAFGVQPLCHHRPNGLRPRHPPHQPLGTALEPIPAQLPDHR